jgi:hypothetical protein
VAPEVLEAMLPFLREHFGNPSSGHAFGPGASTGGGRGTRTGGRPDRRQRWGDAVRDAARREATEVHVTGLDPILSQ